MMKVCSKCGVNKSLEDYHSDKSNKNGKRNICKNCIKIIKQVPKKAAFRCENCDTEIITTKASLQRKKTNFCRNCYSKCTQGGIKRPQFTKENSARWNGGEYISSDGYKMVKCENEFHPSGRQKYKREHILVIEKIIGRELKTQRGHMGEQVHHIDGDKLNNSPDNLLLCKDTREHKQVDCQLHELAFELVRLGVITFDFNTKIYVIEKDKINGSTI